MLHLNLAKKPGISIHQNKAGCRQPALFFTLPKSIRHCSIYSEESGVNAYYGIIHYRKNVIGAPPLDNGYPGKMAESWQRAKKIAKMKTR